MTSICVFCASSAVLEEKYNVLAEGTGAALAAEGFHIVYGGARHGMMGKMADAALAAGGRVTGVIPEVLGPQERAHAGLSELHIVSDMHERQQKMAALSDGFVVLPGGLGTLAEFFEILTWKAIGLHAKPVALINAYGFWDALLGQLSLCEAERFLHAEQARLFEVFHSPAQACEYFTSAGDF